MAIGGGQFLMSEVSMEGLWQGGYHALFLLALLGEGVGLDVLLLAYLPAYHPGTNFVRSLIKSSQVNK